MAVGRSGLRGRAALVVAAACAAVLLASCTSQVSPGTTSTTSTTSTTTTTLPTPVNVDNSGEGGSVSFLGTAQRVSVSPVPPGASTASRPIAGSAAYLTVEHLAFRRFGSGTPLVMIGGEDMTMSYWDPALLSALSGHYEVVLVDLPGTGYSFPAAGRVTLEWWADEMAGFIQALGLVHPVVLGWGLGGDVALDLAERHPTFLSSLVVVDTPIRSPGLPAQSSAVRRAFESRWLSMSGLAQLWFGSAQLAARASWLVAMSTVLPDALTYAARQLQFTVANEVSSSQALFDGLQRVSVPSLIVYGGLDSYGPAADAVVLQETLPHSRTLELPNGDFAAIMEYEATFVAGLEQFTG